MALLTPEHLKEIHDTAELFAVGYDDICPGDIASLFDHIDALTQENADLHARLDRSEHENITDYSTVNRVANENADLRARIAGYEQSERERFIPLAQTRRALKAAGIPIKRDE